MDIVEISPLVESVDVRGNAIPVRALSIADIGNLVFRFPELRALADKDNRPDVAQILALSEQVLAAVIAAACPVSESSAANLVLGERAEIIAKILKVTMPRGLGPFVETLSSLLSGLPGMAAVASPPPSTS